MVKPIGDVKARLGGERMMTIIHGDRHLEEKSAAMS